MSDYISREAAIKEFGDADADVIADYGADYGSEYGYSINKVRGVLRLVPAADVAPVVHGEWRHSGGDEWCCTNCGNVIHTEGSWERPEQKYCDECGAKMGKLKEERHAD